MKNIKSDKSDTIQTILIGSEKKFNIKRITEHPSYKFPLDTNDIAVMEMTSKTHFGDDINRICLPKQSEILPIGSKCYISGRKIFHEIKM